jgi:hypothetical protein
MHDTTRVREQAEVESYVVGLKPHRVAHSHLAATSHLFAAPHPILLEKNLQHVQDHTIPLVRLRT